LKELRERVDLMVSEDGVTKVLNVLSHPIRRDILKLLSEKGECSFTDLLNALEVDTGKLSFHLRSLQAFIEQTPAGKYKLSRAGERAVGVIRDIRSWASGADVESKLRQVSFASFRRRVYAFLIDFALVLAVIGSVFLVAEVFLPLLLGSTLTLDVGVLFFLTLVLLWGYSTLLEGFKGQTIGKIIVGLHVVRTDGKRVSYEHAAVRNFGKAFLLPLDLLIELHNKPYLRFFDKLAGTYVIDVGA
jgi:uncharacterized RDD family membrane protein YckC/DNA-binding HxlR family transcriptional regulator